jgi:hypothetical protein
MMKGLSFFEELNKREGVGEGGGKAMRGLTQKANRKQECARLSWCMCRGSLYYLNVFYFILFFILLFLLMYLLRPNRPQTVRPKGDEKEVKEEREKKGARLNRMIICVYVVFCYQLTLVYFFIISPVSPQFFDLVH